MEVGLFPQLAMRSCMSFQSQREGVFKVITVDNKQGTIEVTDKFLLYTGSLHSELWPLNSLCRYSYDSFWFEFEVMKNYPGLLPGQHRFYTKEPQHLFDVVAKKKSKNTFFCAWEGPVTYPITTTKRNKLATADRLVTGYSTNMKSSLNSKHAPSAARQEVAIIRRGWAGSFSSF